MENVDLNATYVGDLEAMLLIALVTEVNLKPQSQTSLYHALP